MPLRLGAHSERLSEVRSLSSVKGRSLAGNFAFEGPTLLEEARNGGIPILEIYATEAAYAAAPIVAQIEAAGTPVYLVDDRAARKISDLETPTGIVAITPLRLRTPAELMHGPILLLADLNDPGNAGTLLRSAEAFGAAGVIFGDLGVDPFHPKVVRGAMGALFRLPLAHGGPQEVEPAARAAGIPVFGLAMGGDALASIVFPADFILAVGHERHGLGRWEGLCGRRAGIPMRGKGESLNAGVAGSIALYEALRSRG
ncbi:MAG TPA: RNA methyltransferase [Candidatus Acidoferrales bacterium]|nr:RNA methyltransferase [Candidatus Acidoferrales bacterium]